MLKLINNTMQQQHLLLLLAFLAIGFQACSSEESEALEYAKEQNTILAIDSFLETYPNGSYLNDAREIKENHLWRQAQYEGTAYYYKKYIQNYPQGDYLQMAMDSLQAIPRPPFDLSNLLKMRFVGLIDYGDVEKNVLSMRFTDLEIAEADSIIEFEADLNLPDLHKDLKGHINKKNNHIHFIENESDKVKVNLANGRLYIRDEQLLIESIDPKQYWRLRQ